MKNCTTKHRSSEDDAACLIIREFNRIAVVGLSGKPWRPSYRVASYLLRQGYDVIPVNPELMEVLGREAFPDLVSAPGPVEVVDIFRRAEHIPAIVEEAIRIGARAVWMQSGLSDPASAERARGAGLLVVMGRCMMAEHQLHLQGAHRTL
jgi:predicted CoA-binding protein